MLFLFRLISDFQKLVASGAMLFFLWYWMQIASCHLVLKDSGSAIKFGVDESVSMYRSGNYPFGTAVLAKMHHQHLGAVHLGHPEVLRQVAVGWRQIRRVQHSNRQKKKIL